MWNLVRAARKRYRLALFVALFAAMVGAYAMVAAPTAHAQTIGGSGGCTYFDSGSAVWDSYDNHNLYHTSVCVFGPYWDNHGKYYMFTGSCWLDSAQQYQKAKFPNIDVIYDLGCTQDDNVTTYNWQSTWAAYCSSCTPAMPVGISFGTVRVPAGRTVQVYTNGFSRIYLGNDAGDMLFANPSNGAISKQYLP